LTSPRWPPTATRRLSGDQPTTVGGTSISNARTWPPSSFQIRNNPQDAERQSRTTSSAVASQLLSGANASAATLGASSTVWDAPPTGGNRHSSTLSTNAIALPRSAIAIAPARRSPGRRSRTTWPLRRSITVTPPASPATASHSVSPSIACIAIVPFAGLAGRSAICVALRRSDSSATRDAASDRRRRAQR
jgi:hypothetical protein